MADIVMKHSVYMLYDRPFPWTPCIYAVWQTFFCLSHTKWLKLFHIRRSMFSFSSFLLLGVTQGRFPFSENFCAGWFFRAENSWGKNIINFLFPRGQRTKKDIKNALYQHYCRSNHVKWYVSLLSLICRDDFEIIFIRYFLFIEINSKSSCFHLR